MASPAPARVLPGSRVLIGDVSPGIGEKITAARAGPGGQPGTWRSRLTIMCL